MTGLPLGFYTGLFALCVVTALASGAYALINARSIARWADSPDNELEPGPRTSRGRRPTRRAGVVAAILSMVATTGAVVIMALFASGAFDSDVLTHSTEVLRP